MKKVKITVLKTTLDKELAAEYGVKGLTACPMHKAGQVFYADYAKPEGLMRRGRPFINMYLHWLTEPAVRLFIMETGSESQGWLSAAATTG